MTTGAVNKIMLVSSVFNEYETSVLSPVKDVYR
jgi:hypothetical protein